MQDDERAGGQSASDGDPYQAIGYVGDERVLVTRGANEEERQIAMAELLARGRATGLPV